MRRNDYLPTYTTDEGAFYRAANPEVQGPGEPKDQDPQQARTLGMWIPVESVGKYTNVVVDRGGLAEKGRTRHKQCIVNSPKVLRYGRLLEPTGALADPRGASLRIGVVRVAENSNKQYDSHRHKNHKHANQTTTTMEPCLTCPPLTRVGNFDVAVQQRPLNCGEENMQDASREQTVGSCSGPSLVGADQSKVYLDTLVAPVSRLMLGFVKQWYSPYQYRVQGTACCEWCTGSREGIQQSVAIAPSLFYALNPDRDEFWTMWIFACFGKFAPLAWARLLGRSGRLLCLIHVLGLKAPGSWIYDTYICTYMHGIAVGTYWADGRKEGTVSECRDTGFRIFNFSKDANADGRMKGQSTCDGHNAKSIIPRQRGSSTRLNTAAYIDGYVSCVYGYLSPIELPYPEGEGQGPHPCMRSPTVPYFCRPRRYCCVATYLPYLNLVRIFPQHDLDL
ncbi:hypothetical protein CIB48_g7868 [Xylaria polymorpha]|nr:hypothetical protein CIB48_g7868 [Xylaria polymorpha]